MSEYPHPVFVVGDTAKALRVTIRDKDGVAVSLAGGTAKLFAKCVETGDTPGSGSGLTGTFPNGGSDGVVDFAGVGNACALGSGRQMQLYYYVVKYTASGGGISYSNPEGHFLLRSHP